MSRKQQTGEKRRRFGEGKELAPCGADGDCIGCLKIGRDGQGRGRIQALCPRPRNQVVKHGRVKIRPPHYRNSVTMRVRMMAVGWLGSVTLCVVMRAVRVVMVRVPDY
jgi:hypothetical protein